MKLLNTTTFKISEFHDYKIPKYAILSHTWGDEEVSYQDWSKQASVKKAGHLKIRNFCKICRGDGYDWAWVDTCCIDKASSAELSEAINSMYRCYKRKRCYAYLVDVPRNDNVRGENSAFSRSRWFTRGWTLQELIAPVNVYFYSKDWVKIAEREAHSHVIARITGIPEEILHGYGLSGCSIAQKMSWASKRETTRVEDIAYCLLGLFDINMPLLYGEGSKAFIRLQEEIMKSSADHTLFAWTETLPSDKRFAKSPLLGYQDVNTTTNLTGITWLRLQSSGLLAESPAYFAQSSRFVRKDIEAFKPKPYAMTNRGLEIELPLCPPKEPGGNQLAILNCGSEISPSKHVAIYLVPQNNQRSFTEDEFRRTLCHKLEYLDYENVVSSLQKIYIGRGVRSFSIIV